MLVNRSQHPPIFTTLICGRIWAVSKRSNHFAVISLNFLPRLQFPPLFSIAVKWFVKELSSRGHRTSLLPGCHKLADLEIRLPIVRFLLRLTNRYLMPLRRLSDYYFYQKRGIWYTYVYWVRVWTCCAVLSAWSVPVNGPWKAPE